MPSELTAPGCFSLPFFSSLYICLERRWIQFFFFLSLLNIRWRKLGIRAEEGDRYLRQYTLLLISAFLLICIFDLAAGGLRN